MGQVLDRPLFPVEVDELPRWVPEIPVAPLNVQGVHLLILFSQDIDADCCPLEGFSPIFLLSRDVFDHFFHVFEAKVESLLKF